MATFLWKSTMAAFLLRSILPVASKVSCSIPRNFENYKFIYPETKQIFWSPNRCVASVSASGPTTKDLSYNDIVDLKQMNKIILIDVREPAEIQETGLIAGSFNIPLGELKNALQLLSPADFLKKYGVHKPKPDADLVFTCRSGKRSRDAMQTAESVGFPNSRHYVGGFLDWQKHNP